MSTGLPRKLTVAIDTREKIPILFPSTIRVKDPRTRKPYLIHIETKKIKLNTGDYCLLEYPKCCIIERKASQSELFGNFETQDSIRQGKALIRLEKECTDPIIMIEASPTELLTCNKYIKSPDLFVSNLLCQIYKLKKRGKGIEIMWITTGKAPTRRRKVGEFLLHRMLTPILLGQENGQENGQEIKIDGVEGKGF